MKTTIEAIYQDGKIVLPHPLSLPDRSPVRGTVEADSERAAWLALSEVSPTRVLDNPADDVFSRVIRAQS